MQAFEEDATAPDGKCYKNMYHFYEGCEDDTDYIDSDSDSELEENVQDAPLSVSQISQQEIANTLK